MNSSKLELLLDITNKFMFLPFLLDISNKLLKLRYH